MCGRYTSVSPTARLAETFHVDEVRVDELPVRFNVAPTQPVYAVAQSPGPRGSRLLGALRWGLVPPWAGDPSVGSRMINARSEGIERKGAFKEALVRRRCIIPADSFYEWQVRGEGRSRTKQPYAIARVDGQPMAFAGLWELWRDRDQPDQPPLRTCVIITTEANERLAPIHHRMPVMLPPDAWAAWVDPAQLDVTKVLPLLVPAPGEDVHAWPVSTLVNSVANDSPELLDPARDQVRQIDALPGLGTGTGTTSGR